MARFVVDVDDDDDDDISFCSGDMVLFNVNTDRVAFLAIS